MGAALTLAFLLAGLLAGTGDDCPGARTLERADLAGVVKLTDILRRLPGVSWSSVDGFDLRPHAGGAMPADETPWLVLIDGVPVITGAFGIADFHLLPVEPAEVIRVVHCPGAAIAAGRFAGAGTLEITTSRRRAEPRWGVLAEASAANESGDPGPRRYLPGAAPNVDKIGSDVALVVNSPFLTASGRFERRYASDPAALERNTAALGHFPAVRYGAVGIHASRPRSAVRFDGGATYAADLWYLPSAGRELPMRRLGAQGTVSAGLSTRGLAVGARASVSAARLDRRPEVQDSVFGGFDPRWRELGGTFDLEVRAPDARRSLAAGIHVGATSATGAGLDGASRGLLRGWLHRGGDSRTGWRRRSDLAIVAGADDVGLEAAVAVERLLPTGGVSLTISRDDTIPEEVDGSLYWRGRGYEGLDEPAVPYTRAAIITRGTDWSIRLDASTVVVNAVELHGSALFRELRGLMMENGDFEPDSSSGVAGATVATGGHSGRMASVLLWAGGEHRQWRWSASYRFERAIAGDTGFQEAWDVVPAHLGRASLSLRPDPSLLLRTAMEARSHAEWDAYQAFDGIDYPGGSGTYRRHVPSALILDVDVEKSLLGDRLTLTASLHNLLNATERSHPLGAALAFRLWTRAVLRL